MCSIGICLKENCSDEVAFKTFTDFDKEDCYLLKVRSNCKEIQNVCVLHCNNYLLKFSLFQNKCCDPLTEHPNVWKRKYLREITKDHIVMYGSIAQLIPGQKLCTNCRHSLSKALQEDETNVCASGPTSSKIKKSDSQLKDSTDDFVPSCTDALNKSLLLLDESPIDALKFKGKSYPKRKLKKIKTNIVKKLKYISPAGSGIHDCLSDDSNGAKNDSTNDYNTIMTQLKEKYHDPNCTRREKFMILSILPKSWGSKRVMDEFQGTSKYMVRNVKKAVEENGILIAPNPKPGPLLSKDTQKIVYDFYENDEVSRCMPGKKDCVSIRRDGKKVHEQKRLILANLKEIYALFKQKNPKIKIGFSKFAELRPKHCVLPGASGTHSVCVCTVHQNVKLMIEGAKLSTLTKDGIQLATYHDALKLIMCVPSRPECNLGTCSDCPGVDYLKAELESVFNDNFLDEIQYKQWQTTDRCNLEIVHEPARNFIITFARKLLVLRDHHFIATQQAAFLQDAKESLQTDEIIVSGDFAENYSFVLQDAAQGYHWNNSQATLHPFLCYYMQNAKIEHTSFVFISDCLTHDTAAVYTFQKLLIPLLLKKVPGLKKILYFSDGCAAQYKNRKNFINLCLHESDFGVPATWHFFATSHGKGPCDGVGGCVKRLAARASLQKPYEDQIMSPNDLFDWAKANLKSSTFQFVTRVEMEATRHFLSERFKILQTIAGTRSFHSFEPTSSTTLRVKRYSSSAESKDVQLILDEEDENTIETEDESDVDEDESDVDEDEPDVEEATHTLCIDNIGEYVTLRYDGHWWLAFVLEKTVTSEELKVRFLYPHGPSPSFTYPPKDDELVVPVSHVLTTLSVQLGGSSGRTYKIKEEDSKAATTLLACK